MQRCCIYKIKEESKSLFVESYLSEYVIVEEFGRNPLCQNSELYCVYKHIHLDTMEYTSQIIGYFILPHKEFKEHFELYMEMHEINEKLRELNNIKD